MRPDLRIVLMGFLTSLTRLKAFEYPVYEKTMLTKALARSLPLLVVPSNEFLKLTVGSGIDSTFPPRTTKPVMLMKIKVRILAMPKKLVAQSEYLLWAMTQITASV
jgi:hypothetical protein